MKYQIAIIVPFYNTEKYLHKCIQSILIQKDVSLQVILVDDYSSDRSLFIAEHYASIDRRIRLLKNKENVGQGISRNSALEFVNAEYVYFIDSDDYLVEKDALSILYKVAKDNHLDICSPDVPSHYFEKPLEMISCIPCKSQFIKASIIEDFQIRQPNVRSGQDGVFSHLVLTHCQRIGMAKKAKFHYTHAREGSTFVNYLKKHDIVFDLLKIHYEAIEAHYNKYDLWNKNTLRLLYFISDETIRNRINPHFNYMSAEQKERCFGLLKNVANKALDKLDNEYYSYINPIILDLCTVNLIEFIEKYSKNWLNYKFVPNFNKNENIYKKDLIICKIANKIFNVSTPKIINSKGNLGFIHEQKIDTQVNKDVSSGYLLLEQEVKQLRSKVDFLINTLNNSTIQIVSSIKNQECKTLENGNQEIIVSLTTLPHRLTMVHYVIESIFAQTIVPFKIILWISDKISDELITPELKSLMLRGLEICKVNDVGPHTKLMYAIQRYPDKIIITVDDDIIYPMNMIQYLWQEHEKHPQCIIGNWVRELSFDKNGKVKGIRSGRLLTPPNLEKEIEQAKAFNSQPTMLGFAYGTSGVLYPPNSLNKQFDDIGLFRSLCPKEDDVWFKAMSLLNRTPVVATNLGINPIHHSLTGSQKIALRHDNHGLNQNEQQMRNVFEYFDLYQYLGRN